MKETKLPHFDPYHFDELQRCQRGKGPQSDRE